MTEEDIRRYKEKAITDDMFSIENRVRHAFNQGLELGRKLGQEKPAKWMMVMFEEAGYKMISNASPEYEVIKKLVLNMEYEATADGGYIEKGGADKVKEESRVKVGDICWYKENHNNKFRVTRIWYEGDCGFFAASDFEGHRIIDDGTLALIEKIPTPAQEGGVS